jgi:serine protease Do
MLPKTYFPAAAIGAGALALAAAGGYWTRADAEAGAVNAGAPAAAAPQSFADIVQRVAPAVVSIDVVEKAAPQSAALEGPGGLPFPFGQGGQNGQDGPFGFQFRQLIPQQPDTGPMRATASGFFISPDGYIVTNNHVIDGAAKITVRDKDGREFAARLIGADPTTDLAVIKVEGHDFPYVSFEDRAKPRVGDWVVAVGNPLGLGGTATAGIVSALNREHVEDSNYVGFMQIDAPINRGNSGGPTFDVYGRVVGVNTAIFSPSGGSIGIGFDIPADVAASVSRQLIDHGKVVRGYIGAAIQDLTPEMAASLGLPAAKGALVADVVPGGPSDRAGLKSGDLVLGMDGQPVASALDLTRHVGMARPGDVIHLQIRRDGRMVDVDLHAGLRPSEQALAANDLAAGADSPAGVLGMRLAPDPKGGVVVQRVDPNSDASDKGLGRGDVILRAGDHKVTTPADVSAAVSDARREGRKEVLVLVAHGGHQVFVPLSTAQAAG